MDDRFLLFAKWTSRKTKQSGASGEFERWRGCRLSTRFSLLRTLQSALIHQCVGQAFQTATCGTIDHFVAGIDHHAAKQLGVD